MQREQTNLFEGIQELVEPEANDSYLEGGALSKHQQEAKQFISTDNILESILSRDNMRLAFKRVKENKGSPGIDNMTVEELSSYLKENWQSIKEQILEGKYKPNAIRKVAIPKDSGGTRELGIPTVLDRLIQQAISQKLVEIYDSGFSAYSYGFRPGRNAQQAVRQAKAYIDSGYENIVDLDIEKFFDRVNHDYLMSRIARTILDKKLLLLIRRYLQAGVMEQGVIQMREEGTPQGSPLSPILSNILLDELDKELEQRGHRFVRYADDCTIYASSERAAHRIKSGINKFLEKRLKLHLNQDKSGVRKPDEIKILGYGFLKNKQGEWKIRISKKAKEKLKKKLKRITSRIYSIAISKKIRAINLIIRGWGNYFKLTELKNDFSEVDGWIRTRLRMCYWKNWKQPRTRAKELKALGINEEDAIRWSYSRKGYARMANSKVLKYSLTNEYFKKLGYFELTQLSAVVK